MVLDEGQYYGVSLCEESVSIQLDIILDKSIGIVSCEHRKEFIDNFESTLRKICKELIPASHKQLKKCIPCPFCHEPHVKYDSKPGEAFCRTQGERVPKEYYQNLVQYEGTYRSVFHCKYYNIFVLTGTDSCTTGQALEKGT